MPRWTCALAVFVFVASPATAAATPPPLGGLEALYDWPEEAPNLLKNTSFETADDLGKPLQWTVQRPPYLFRDDSRARSGAWALHMNDTHLAGFTPSASQSVNLAPGWYNLRAWVKPSGAGAKKSTSGGRIRLKDSGSTDLIRGTRPWFLLERRDLLVLPGAQPSVRVEAYQKPSGSIFFDDLALHRLKPAAVEGFLLYPNYRGALFEDRSQVIRIQVTVRPEELGKTLADVAVQLSLETAAGSVVVQREFPASAGPTPVTLDASVAPRGELRLRLRALSAARGTLLFEHPAYRLVKLSASRRADLGFYVDPDNVVVLGGRRRFALGIYDTTEYSTSPEYYEPRIAKIAEAPLNLYVNYWIGGAPDSALSALTTTLARHGMSYLHTVARWYEDRSGWSKLPDCGGRTSEDLGQEGYWSCRAEALGSDPALAGWYTADEQSADRAEPVFDQYRALRAHDPGSLAFIAQVDALELSRWRDAADVFDAHAYPIIGVPEGSLSPLEQVTTKADGAQAALSRSRTVWAVIQYFQRGSQGHFPTYDELRAMSYMAIVAGAKGLLYWSYGAKGLSWVRDPAQREEYWQRLVRLTREISSLEPVLLSPDTPGVLTSVSAPEIRYLAKKVGNVRYVIAVNNTSRDAVAATFRLTQSAVQVDVLNEGRGLAVGGTTFSDVFGPYQVHVYRVGAP